MSTPPSKVIDSDGRQSPKNNQPVTPVMQPIPLKVTGEFQVDMSALFEKLNGFETMMIGIQSTVSSISTRLDGVERSDGKSRNSPLTLPSNFTVADIHFGLGDDTGSYIWNGDIEIPIDTPQSAIQVNDDLKANMERKNSLVSLVNNKQETYYSLNVILALYSLQFRFVVDECLSDNPKVAVQKFLSRVFTYDFLVNKSHVKLRNGGENRTLTPGRSQRRVVLIDLHNLVMKPLLCEFTLI
jgi:hypothetical protein